MNVQEINNKIADLEKRSKNPSLPASAVTSLNKMIADLKAQIKTEPSKPAEPKKAEPKKVGVSTFTNGQGSKMTDADIEAETKRREKKAKPEPKKAEPKAKAEAKYPEDEDDYCDKVIKGAKERRAKAKANAKKRANEPKKTPATKNKEKVEKTVEKVLVNVEKRAEKGQVTRSEIVKLIAEHTEAIKKLNKILAQLK